MHQVGTACLTWADDHGGKSPMQVSTNDGGTMEWAATANVAACFQVMSNELLTPKVLICPADKDHVAVTNFSALNGSHVSYFIGLDPKRSKPQTFLDGDDNFAVGGVSVKSGILNLWTNSPISWTAARHELTGNIGLSDGSVQQTTQSALRRVLQETGLATNRLAIP